MGQALDLVGKQFGYLTVLYSYSEKDKNGESIRKHHCLCKCGNTSEVPTGNLTSGTTRSCGCLIGETASKFHTIDLIGQTIGTWTVNYIVTKKEGLLKPIQLRHCTCIKCGFELDMELKGLTGQKTRECPKCRHGIKEGDIFEYLTVKEFLYKKNERGRFESWWLCQCKCGNPKYVKPGDLIDGHVRSCGCLQKDKLKIVQQNKRIDLTGQKYNALTAQYSFDVFENGKNNVYWHCICECGNPKDVLTSHLIRGVVKSCGCKKSENISKAQTKDLIGQRFGKLVVVKRVSAIGEQVKYECQCDCGSPPCIIPAQTLHRGSVKSCGCYREWLPHVMFTTHGLSKHPLYKKFYGMIARCYNPSSPMYYAYGGRGIQICDEWLEDFTKFYDWAIENGWKKGLTIDRIDNDGNYCPENCQWLTRGDNIRKANQDRYIKRQKYRQRSIVNVVNHRDKGICKAYEYASTFVW